ncbi:MAG: IS630 family transposase [Verrucomicrobia bacterium]|nr:IS630 family transposase [Verrucomicrobiota bacterium]
MIRKPNGLLKKLARLADDPAVDLWSTDECHFQQHGTRCVMWVPPEETDPVLLHEPTRRSIALFGAVNLRAGQMHALFCDPFNGDTFTAFLRTLLRRRAQGRRMVVVSDNAAYRKSPPVRAFVAQCDKRLELLYLPPYSPDLNPIERVWKLTRRLCTHNRYFPDLDELREIVGEQLRAWWKPNEALRRLCRIT